MLLRKALSVQRTLVSGSTGEAPRDPDSERSGPVISLNNLFPLSIPTAFPIQSLLISLCAQRQQGLEEQGARPTPCAVP